MLEYENFHCHTSYSNALTAPDSTVGIEDYAKVYKERGHHVLCISEHGNRSNVWQQFELANKYSDDNFKMTPLAAAEAYFVPDRTVKEHRGYHLILVAKNMDGFYELNEILSEANLTGFYYHARVDFELLRRLNYKNFLCTTACFAKGTKVKTCHGYKNIEDITSNDYILNMYGEWEKVNYPTSRKYNGIGYKIFLRSQEEPIICTENHKFLVTTTQKLNYIKKYPQNPLKWIEAKDIRIDCSESAKHFLLEPIKEIKYNNNVIINKCEWKNKLIKRSYYCKKPVNEKIILSSEVMRLFGLWLGDGHIAINEENKYYCVGISFSEKEFNTYWNDFIEKASNEIGVKWSTTINKKNHKIELASHSLEFVEFMHYLFGNTKAGLKHIPNMLLHTNKENDFNLMYGLLLSDGYFRTQIKDGYKYGQCTLTSISKILIDQFKELLDSYNIKVRNTLTAKEHIDINGVHHKESYYFTINNNAFIDLNKLTLHGNNEIINLFEKAIDHCSKLIIDVDGIRYKKKFIKSIEKIFLNEKVFCLNDNTHSFVCENVIVHNCVAGPSDEQTIVDLHNIFRENFYLEVQPHPQKIQVDRNKWMVELSKKYRLPLIFATDSHYVYKEEKELRRELLLASKITYGNEDEFLLYLPTVEEAYQMMRDQGVLNRAQIEEAFENTLILREFEGVHFDKDRKFPISRPELTQEQRNSLYKHMVCDGYIEQAGMPTKEEAVEIHKEMDTIVETNSADYFIGLHDMLELGKKKGGILTTTSRGSACGFASNYALKFTNINRLHVPVRMYPARFISKAKLLSGSMPDIDSNLANVQAFEEAGKEIFGEWGCLPMVAYGTAKTLSAFKLLARARDAAAQLWAETDERAKELKVQIDEVEKKEIEGYGNNADLEWIKKKPYYIEYEKLLEEHGAIPFAKANEIAKQIQNYEMDVKYALENNTDDPDYNVDDDIQIESYVEEKYLKLIEESKKYKGIITSISCHPCGHLVYHKDLRREIGVIRVKSKSGNKEPVMAAYIDGNFADKFGYCKSDMLRVDVVKVIHDAFKLAGQEVLTVDELVEKTKNDKAVWDILAKGFTMGCNQTERPKTTERVMQFKPQNTVELSALIAAIRPGAKSLVNDFVARRLHQYNIPAMDKLLKLDGATGVTGESSFLFYDEQIMVLAEAAGIAPEDTNALIKHIKKKHHDDVAKYKEQFIPGFIKYLTDAEHVDIKHAEKTSNDVWTVILNSASYLFNLSHAYAMCLDCLYGMYLKTYYPYEFYVTLLKLYDEKKNTDKISAIIAEMKRYKNISLTAGRFGQDNRDWVVDKEHNSISQSLSSIRYMSKKAAKDLYELGKIKKIPDNDIESILMGDEANSEDVSRFATFTDVLRELQMNTCLDTRQIAILIELNYFEQFGKSGKLMKVYDEFFNGKQKLTKIVKSFEARLASSRKYEKSLPDEELSIGQRLLSELSNVGLCLSTDKTQPDNLYFVREIDAKYGIKAKLYSVNRGTTGVVRFKKDSFAKQSFETGDCVQLLKYNKSPRYTYRGGERVALPGEFDIWAESYKVIKAPKEIKER